jgi:cysteine desulfurase
MARARIYLDFNATTPLHPVVEKNLKKYWQYYGNPSSMHADGRDARTAIDVARERIGDALGVSRHHILFVGSGSEANNQLIRTVVDRALISGQSAHVLMSPIEHACIRNAVAHGQQLGLQVTEIPIDASGRVIVSEISSLIQSNTALISVMHANNETGVIQPLSDVAAIAKSHGVLVHTDMVQSLGKLPISWDTLGVDFATISAHKIGGPKGIAALIVRDDSQLTPLRAVIAGRYRSHPTHYGICRCGGAGTLSSQ